MRPQFRVLPLCLAAALCGNLAAQAPSPKPTPKPAARIVNGNFERSSKSQDLWSGVDAQGFLLGARATVNLLIQSGGIGEVSVPASVAIGDMNGDGLPDIVSADALGYLRIYFNEGTRTEPKFGVAEIVGVFVGVQPTGLPYTARRAPRVHITNTSGKPDLLIGNYNGEIFLLRNEGSALKPVFRQPVDFARVTLPTTTSDRRWGNVFAPLMFDWNRDGKADLLIGEGSYSANNIHLALNQGTTGAPKFSETQRMILAFGDGREQLTPALVDYNGDGNQDLLISARDGKVGVHLHPSQPWKPGDELPFSSFVATQDGKELTFGGSSTIAVGDLNGDGLFDIIAGRPNGRVALVLNKGTEKEPKFAVPTDLKSAAPTQPRKAAVGWDIDVGLQRGNILCVAEVVTNADDPGLGLPEGQSALRVSYAPNTNKVLPAPYIALPAVGNFNPNVAAPTLSAEAVMRSAPSNFVLIRQVLRAPLKPGAPYTVSMRVKGTRLTGVQGAIVANGRLSFGDDKVTVGDRGRATVQRNEVRETVREPIAMAPGATWSDVKKSFSIRFKEKDLNSVDRTEAAVLDIMFQVAPGVGSFYVTDISVTDG